MFKDLLYNILYNIIILYIIASFYEWSIHKYIMHGDPEVLKQFPIIGERLRITAESHQYHHKQVLMNMHYIDEHSTNGFQWFDSVIMFILVMVSFKILTNIENNYITTGLVFLIVIIYCFLWNTIHNQMHYTTKTMTLKEGVPSIILDRSIIKNPIYKFLYINHGIHHLQKGDKYNYNIIFPMFDDLFFTKKYGKCYNNVAYCKLNKNKDKRCKSKVVGCLSTDLKK